jgi:hypothetical protein
MLNSQLMRRTILLLLFFDWLCLRLMAQDSMQVKHTYRNSVRFNATNPIIFGGRSIIFGYERVLKHNRSFSITLGQAGFPSFNLENADSLRANKILGEGGFHASADYRFYLSKENKYDAPRGVYIGPYYSFNYFERTNGWSLKSTEPGPEQDIQSKTTLSVHIIGFEMGWQFILWNRVTIDMILAGPGVGFYSLGAKLGSNLSDADRKKLYEKLNQALADKFPGYSVAIDEEEFQKKGASETMGLGFRYMVMLGYRF